MFNHMPTGILGLMVVGLLAAALSSFNSAINSMTSSLFSDLYLPWRQKRDKGTVKIKSELKESRFLVIIMGIVLTAFAIIAALMQEAGDQSLVDFALGIMSFSYAGMLGIFLCAVLTRRGNVYSVVAALITGCLVVLLLQPGILSWWSTFCFGVTLKLAWPWWVVVGGSISFLVCCIGKKKELVTK